MKNPNVELGVILRFGVTPVVIRIEDPELLRTALDRAVGAAARRAGPGAASVETRMLRRLLDDLDFQAAAVPERMM